MFQELALYPSYSECRNHYTDSFLNFWKETYLTDR